MPRRTPRKVGRPTLLTKEREARFLDIVKKGNHLTTACAVIGIGTSTLYRWLDQALEADEHTAEGHELTDAQRVYVEFRDALALARAHAEMRAVAVIERSMEGGFVISERPLQNSDGDVQYGPDGQVLYERTYTQPDGRLALNYLARSSPSVWGQNPTQRLEITGAGVGALGAGGDLDEDQAAALGRQLAAVAARRREDEERDRLELEAGVEDAEIVEDQAG
jgi:transposase-like protein